MKCLLFKSVGLAILFSLTMCLSAQAMLQDDNAPKEVAEVEQADDPKMTLARIGLRGLASSELLGQHEEIFPQSIQLLDPSGLRTLWAPFLSLDGEFADADGRLVETYMDLGLKYQPVEPAYLAKQLGLPEGQGLIVRDQEESGAGFKNGFRVGDIVLAVDDTIIGSTTDLMAALTETRGSQCLVKAKRDGSPIELTIKLSEPDPAQSPQRWILGIYPEAISELAMAQLDLEGGIVVTGLTEGGAAGKSGIVKHDIITHVDGQPVHTPEQLREILVKSNGEELKVDFVRGGNELSVTFVPERHVDHGKQNVGYINVDASWMLRYDTSRINDLMLTYDLAQDVETADKGSKLEELEQQVNELTKAVEKLQESRERFDDQQEERK